MSRYVDVFGRETWSKSLVARMESHVDFLAEKTETIPSAWTVIGQLVVYFLLPKGGQSRFIEWLEADPSKAALYENQPSAAVNFWLTR